MIIEAENYNEIKGYLDRMNIAFPTNMDLSKSMAGILDNELKGHFSKAKIKDFFKVREDTRIVEIDKVLSDYLNCRITKAQMTKLLSEGEYGLYEKDINSATRRRNETVCTRRDMRVHWITGESGGGKSAFAQYLACKKYEIDEIAMANEGEHMFDGYDLQPCYIMDEFRGSSMKFSSYLQLTDNFINAIMGARYHNVDFKNCKDMYITSIKTPQECYVNMQDSSSEPMYQAYRRLGFKYYDLRKTGDKKGVVYLVETMNDPEAPTKILRKTIVYNIKYTDGAPEFIELKEPIVVEGF